MPNSIKQPFVEIVYKKYKNVRSFPTLKFLNKAQINFAELDIKIISKK